MFKIIFKRYDMNNDLDFFNKKIAKASKGRFELRKSKNNIFYLYDYHEGGYNTMIRNKEKILGIIENQYLENFTTNEEFKRINKIINNVRGE